MPIYKVSWFTTEESFATEIEDTMHVVEELNANNDVTVDNPIIVDAVIAMEDVLTEDEVELMSMAKVSALYLHSPTTDLLGSIWVLLALSVGIVDYFGGD